MANPHPFATVNHICLTLGIPYVSRLHGELVLDQRFQSYRQSTIARLREKISMLDARCSNERRRLFTLIDEGIYKLEMTISQGTSGILGVIFGFEATFANNIYLYVPYVVVSFALGAVSLFCLAQNLAATERFHSLINYTFYKQRYEARLQHLEGM
jgi:hypothetical protein